MSTKTKIHNFSDLPQETQDRLKAERLELHKKNFHDGYIVSLYNQQGTRYFYARRFQLASQHMAFGGGSYWKISYGAVQFCNEREPFGDYSQRLAQGTKYTSIKRDGKTIDIPKELATKKEVLALVKEIGIFNI